MTKIQPKVQQIYTTGVFCEPVKCTNPNTGKDEWRWMVTGFEEDSYSYGFYINPAEITKSRETLFYFLEDE